MRRMVLGIAVAVAALMQGNGMADDQQIADYIKSRLQVEQQRGNLRGFNVDMRVDRGTVWFKGMVSNEMQESTILQAAQQAGHLGVVQIVDDIEVRQMQESQVAPTQYQQSVMQRPAEAPEYRQAAYQVPQQSTSPNTLRTINASNAFDNSAPMPFAQAGNVPAMQASHPMSAAPAAPMGPMSAGPGMGMGTSPNMPNYAWPGYAAHPNYGAVTYPKQYSPSAWPYIGPFYPYPQVPLGWRKVALEWDDGWWYLDFNDK